MPTGPLSFGPVIQPITIWTHHGGDAAGAVGGIDAFTKLMLHCDGTDAATSFPDSSSSGHTITANGNAQVDTAQFKFATASALFDGTADYLSGPGHADFAAGTGDFTVEFWARWNSLASIQVLYELRVNAGTTNFAIYSDTTSLRVIVAGTTVITGASTLATGTWYHVALARSGSSTKLFLNGTQEGSTYSDSNNYATVHSLAPVIGVAFDASLGFNGWMDEIRVSKGVARWTANFTPNSGPYST